MGCRHGQCAPFVAARRPTSATASTKTLGDCFEGAYATLTYK